MIYTFQGWRGIPLDKKGYLEMNDNIYVGIRL